MAIRTSTELDGSGVTRSVRELLDDARTSESTDIHAARALAQQARVRARTIGDAAGEAEALYRLASIAYTEGEANDAFAIALDARDLARSASVGRVEVWALTLIGLVHHDAGNFSQALESTLAALELQRLPGSGVDEANLLNTIAMIHHSLGDTDRALVTYEAALAAHKRHGESVYHVLTLLNMSEVRARRSEYLLAVSLAEQALELAHHHAREYVPAVLARLATSYCGLGALDEADACLDEAEPLLDEMPGSSSTNGMRYSIAMGRGAVCSARGHLEDAVGEYARALGFVHERGLADALAVHTELAALYKELGRFEEALRHQEERFVTYEAMFMRGTDLRIKTLQIAHDTEAARQQAEILRLRTSELEALVRGRTYDLEEYQLEAFQRLAVLAEFRDTDTGEHTVRVGDVAAAVADELGEDAEWSGQLRLAARLHDIGKVAVPDAILLKPGPLTPDEFAVMRTHTTIGAEILSGSLSPLIQLAAEVALNHHERWDGTGYPAGLAGDDIPLSGRIVTVADVFDALTSARTYKRAWTTAEAVRYIVDGRGAQFEPRVVDAFVRVAVRMHPELADQLGCG